MISSARRKRNALISPGGSGLIRGMHSVSATGNFRKKGPDSLPAFVLIRAEKNGRVVLTASESGPAFKVGNAGEENRRGTLCACTAREYGTIYAQADFLGRTSGNGKDDEFIQAL